MRSGKTEMWAEIGAILVTIGMSAVVLYGVDSRWTMTLRRMIENDPAYGLGSGTIAVLIAWLPFYLAWFGIKALVRKLSGRVDGAKSESDKQNGE